ncbi:hypothetical protein [Pyxidicoccus caerfyrddinensis]|uniref:hypothetical protein n=1 Tax=Pyxidicoccus caerfyrddinensis TaxID=2709663 RepID=UPI0013DB701D|nr:hypothetical protein [Pyxidicoccus caerfyrddinensis]
MEQRAHAGDDAHRELPARVLADDGEERNHAGAGRHGEACLERGPVPALLHLDVFPDGTWKVLDVGQSGEAMTRLSQHDRRPQWERASVTRSI